MLHSAPGVVRRLSNSDSPVICGVPAQEIALGPFRLDLNARRLLRDGADVGLRPRAFEVLLLLLQNNGQYVDYERLVRAGWGGVTVSRHTVAVTVGEIKSALGEFGSWIHCRPKLGYALEVPKAEELIRLGWHFWSLHTREGFEKALECFQQARQNGADARAWGGMASCYLALSTFGLRHPKQAYDAFLEAYHRVVALTGITPELRADRARGLHLIERRFADAESELRLAIAERPGLAIAYAHLVMIYGTSGQLDEAVTLLEQGYRCDALSLPLHTAEIMLRLWRGEFQEALSCSQKAVERFPGAPLCRSLHAQTLAYSGRFEEALAEAKLATMMAPDIPHLQSLTGRCLARTGRHEEARATLHCLERLRELQYVDPYAIALLQYDLGDSEAASVELKQAIEENSPSVFLFEGDPKGGSLRATARLGQLLAA